MPAAGRGGDVHRPGSRRCSWLATCPCCPGSSTPGRRHLEGRACSGALVICLLGVVDDRWGLDALTKLAGQVAGGGRHGAARRADALPPAGPATWHVRARPGSRARCSPSCCAGHGERGELRRRARWSGGRASSAIAATAFFVFSYVLAVAEPRRPRGDPPALVTAVLAGICLGFLPHNFSPGPHLHGRLRLDAARAAARRGDDPADRATSTRACCPGSASSPSSFRCCCRSP